MVIEVLAPRLGGRLFNAEFLVALVLEDPDLTRAAAVKGDEFCPRLASEWLHMQPMPPGHRLLRDRPRVAEYRLISPTIPPHPGNAAEPDPARCVAAAPAILSALGATFPEPISGTDISDLVWYARHSPTMPQRAQLLTLAAALRAAHPLGACRPHPVLEVLHGAGLLAKSLDFFSRGVFTVAPELR
jgi:hypothetical protein